MGISIDDHGTVFDHDVGSFKGQPRFEICLDRQTKNSPTRRINCELAVKPGSFFERDHSVVICQVAGP